VPPVVFASNFMNLNPAELSRSDVSSSWEEVLNRNPLVLSCNLDGEVYESKFRFLIGVAAAKLAPDEYSFESVGLQYEALYKRALRNHASS
jgi:hypothetical protein